ncbi:MAG: alpha/beta fold hydrolase [Alphaproteobacteria bacterium]|nr:alpha/beta fold hydrolase [Alphaproteobacteria bacterium]MCB9793960.1 alpha/beta fold hydrolase [Alphaproteobacteria bacterium]
MPFATVDSQRLWYETHGEQGSPVLLIMGFAGRGTAWKPQVEGLAHRHRLALYDNRGIGESARFPGVTTIPEMARDALGLLDHLGWAQAHVVGVSMGGMVAQELALRARERVRSLSLIATHAGGLAAVIAPWEGLGLFMQTHLGSPAQRVQAQQRLLYTDAHLAQLDAKAHALELVENFGADPPPETLTAQLAAVLRHDTRGRLSALAGLPVLVVRPEQDKLIHPRHVLDLHRRIPGSRLLNLRQAGHGVTDERREAVNAALLEHFAEADGAGPG